MKNLFRIRLGEKINSGVQNLNVDSFTAVAENVEECIKKHRPKSNRYFIQSVEFISSIDKI